MKTKFEEEFKHHEDCALQEIENHISKTKYITTQQFYTISASKLEIISQNYSSKILSSLVKKKKIIRIINGYYTTPVYFKKNFDYLITTIFIGTNKVIGFFTGQYLLFKFGLIEQVPSIIEIKSFKSHLNLINFKYKITSIRDLESKSYYRYFLTNQPKVIYLLELLLMNSKYKLCYSIKEIYLTFINFFELDFVNFGYNILSQDLPNSIYYNETRKLRTMLVKELRLINNTDFKFSIRID